jgi:nitrous oxidase accessory protein NosD
VDHNIIRNNLYINSSNPNDAASGILLFETSAHVSADHNDLTHNGVGIAIYDAAIGLIVDHNNVTDSHDDGIAAYAGSAQNTISYNKSFQNVPYDCSDYTTGTATAGTANYWIKDMGLTQNRPGLCRQPGA